MIFFSPTFVIFRLGRQIATRHKHFNSLMQFSKVEIQNLDTRTILLATTVHVKEINIVLLHCMILENIFVSSFCLGYCVHLKCSWKDPRLGTASQYPFPFFLRYCFTPFSILAGNARYKTFQLLKYFSCHGAKIIQ